MDSIFGLNRPASLSGMRLLVTVHNDAELALYSSILEGGADPVSVKGSGKRRCGPRDRRIFDLRNGSFGSGGAV